MALPWDFDFTVRYTKDEEKVYVLDRNPWLAKMQFYLFHNFTSFITLFIYSSLFKASKLVDYIRHIE